MTQRPTATGEKLSRRSALALGAGFVLAGTGPVFASVIPGRGTIRPVLEDVSFRVLLDGDPIGFHKVRFRRDGERLDVTTEIEMAVRIAGIRVFRYQHQGRESWDGDRLISLESTTDNDGKDQYLRVQRSENGLRVDGSAFSGEAAADVMPSAYWNRAMTRQSQLMDSQTGAIKPVTVVNEGRESLKLAGQAVETTRYSFTGGLTCRIWFDDRDHWVKLAFASRGGEITYELDPAGPNLAVSAP